MFRKKRCVHIWEKLFDVMIPSALQQMKEMGIYPGEIKGVVEAARATHHAAFSCNQCGEIREFKATNQEE